MNEYAFDQEMERLFPSSAENHDHHDHQEMLDIAYRLRQVDLSSETQRFGEIRERLLERVSSNQTPPTRILPVRRVVVACVAVIALMIAIVFTVPPIRVLAQELLQALFPTTTSQIMIEYNQDDLIWYDSFEAMQQEVAFVIRPFSLPDAQSSDQSSDQSRYFEYNPVRNAASQGIETDERFVRVTQQPIVDAETKGMLSFTFDFEIAPETTVQKVPVGSYEGELVRGMWLTDTPNMRSEPIYRWDADFHFYSLRWQDSAFIYEVQLLPTGTTEKSADPETFEQEIIEIANNLME
jgi:hypothetical protein